MKKLLILLAIAPMMAFGQSNINLAQAFKTSYQHENSGDYLTAAKVLDNNCPEGNYPCHVRTGYLYQMAKNYSKSMEYYQNALKIHPNSIEALLGMTYPASNMEDWEKVMSLYMDILKLDPNHSQANYWLGYMYYLRDDFNNAQKYLEVVVDLYPFDFDSSLLLGWVYLKKGEKEKAEAMFEVANFSSPGNYMVKEAFTELEKAK